MRGLLRFDPITKLNPPHPVPLRRGGTERNRIFFSGARLIGLALIGLVSMGFPGASSLGAEPDVGPVSRDLLSDQEWERLDAAIDRGLRYLATQQKKNNGSFAAPDTGQPGITSLCVLAFLAKGHVPEEGHYSAYYCSQAMFQLGGDYWKQFYPRFMNVLLENQNADGSWSPEGNRDGNFGSAYTTALVILALAPPYQLLPIFQR